MANPAARQTWQGVLASLEVYADRRVVAILFLGFASGLPLLLVGGTLTAWLRVEGVSRSTIGLFAFVMLPYTLKFLWAPIMDQVRLPWLAARLGRRRSWLLLCQLGLIAAIFALGRSDPGIDLGMTAALALLVAFLSASQDIVFDALRIEMLEERQLAAGTANAVTGYRFGMWLAKGGALVIAGSLGWATAYSAMAFAMVIGVITVLLVNEPPEPERPERRVHKVARGATNRWVLISAGAVGLLVTALIAPNFGLLAATLSGLTIALILVAIGRLLADQAWLNEGFVEPFRDFFERNGAHIALVILAFIALFKASDQLIAQMANPFYIDVGFSEIEIGWVSGTFGFLVTFVGTYLIGAIMYRVGIMTGLWISGVLQMASNLMFALLAYVGHDLSLFFVTIGIENLAGGMATGAFVAYLSALCNLRYTAVQYALLTSFANLLFKFVLSPSSGFIVDGVGWVAFFILSFVAGIPALILLYWLGQREIKPPDNAHAMAMDHA